MYTTPLSTLISSLSLNDTQLFLLSSLRLSGRHHSSAECSHTDHFRMTSNLLSLNSSKTEFLLVGRKRQLSKIHNFSTSIDTTQSARNLGFIFDEHLSFSHQISALSKSCYHHIRALRCIRPYLNLHTAKTIATSIGHSKLDYFNSLYYGRQISNTSSPTHSECSCSNCCPGSKIPTHHSSSEISSLA